ncbi:MAG: magnesium transporter [Rhabdochlamydiaceae bacterium]
MKSHFEEDSQISHNTNSNLTDLKTFHLDDIVNEKLTRAFHKETFQIVLHDVVKIACEHSPIDLAYAASRLLPNERAILYENLPDLNAKIDFIVNADRQSRLTIFRHISDAEIKRLIENMPADDALTILEDSSEKRFRRIMDLLDLEKANRIKEIKKHERNTAGRLMTNEFFSFNMANTIGEAAQYIHSHPGIDLSKGVFVQNGEGQLLGYVPFRNLIINPPHISLKQIMRPVLHKVLPEANREEIIDVVERYKLPMLAVVDENDHLIGIINHDDVLEIIEDIADETIANIAGTTEKMNEYDPAYKRFLARTPWLLFTLFAGLINVGVMSSLQSYDGGVLTFALFFVPLITGMSGNIGIQTSTILVRSMATGLISSSSKKQAVFSEIIIGFLSSCVFGIICGLCIYIFNFGQDFHLTLNSAAVGLIVAIGLFGACITGTFLGVYSPLLFSRWGIDPAIASGPIITAFNDFLSMSIFFLIAIGVARLLV